MNNEITLSPETLEAIRQSVATELLKRGFTAPLTITEKATRHGSPYLDVTSEPFQTTPVIMKAIRIDGTLDVAKDEANDVISVGGRIGVSYEHFTGGHNGCELFWITGIIRNGGFYNVEVR